MSPDGTGRVTSASPPCVAAYYACHLRTVGRHLHPIAESAVFGDPRWPALQVTNSDRPLTAFKVVTAVIEVRRASTGFEKVRRRVSVISQFLRLLQVKVHI